jgi:hypothetical protein
MSNTKLLLHYGHFHSSDDKNGQKKITWIGMKAYYIQEIRGIYQYISVSLIFVIQYQFMVDVLCTWSMGALHGHCWLTDIFSSNISGIILRLCVNNCV